MDYLVILVLALVALVKSDIGYQYKVPTSYDVPFGSVGDLNQRRYYHVEKEGSGGLTPSSQLQTPIFEHSLFNGPQNNLRFTGVHQTATGGTFNEPQSNILLSGTHQNKPQSNVQFTGTPQTATNGATFNLVASGDVGIDSKSSFTPDNSQEVEVQKHLYFYSAPDEPEEIRTRIIAPPAPTKKNVKILFIKTPTFNTAPINIPVLPQNEEKTLVYVLVKKPEETSIVIPTPAPSKPAKPEVYFIKYKTQKEAEEAISNIQDTGAGSVNAGFVGSTNFDGVSSTISPGNLGETLVSVTPAPAPSPTYAPSGFGVDVNSAHGANIDTRFNTIGELSGPKVSVTGGAYPQFSSDAVTNFEGSVGTKESGSSIGGAVQLPTSASKGSEEVKVHQVYGPPKNRRWILYE